MAEFVKVARTADVPAGTGVTVEVGGKAIAVFNCDGAFFAIDDTCPHQGGPLGEGELEGTTVTCPWHEWRYDVRTGVNLEDASCKVSAYPVKVEDGDVFVAVDG